jgi:hypothetical protein
MHLQTVAITTLGAENAHPGIFDFTRTAKKVCNSGKKSFADRTPNLDRKTKSRLARASTTIAQNQDRR